MGTHWLKTVSVLTVTLSVDGRRGSEDKRERPLWCMSVSEGMMLMLKPMTKSCYHQKNVL